MTVTIEEEITFCTSNSAKCVFLLELFETEYVKQKSLTHPSFYNIFKSIKEIK